MSSLTGGILTFNKKKTVAENAAAKLPLLAQKFFAAGHETAKPGVAAKATHKFRLMTKRFRYVLELFEQCYGPDLDQRLESLQSLQQSLGEISDCYATKRLLLKRRDLSPGHRAAVLVKLDALSNQKIAAFRRLWKKEFAPPPVESSWKRYLARA